LFENVSDLVGKVDDFIEFAGRGDDAVGDIEGAGEAEGAADFLDFTGGGKGNRLVLGGNGIHP